MGRGRRDAGNEGSGGRESRERASAVWDHHHCRPTPLPVYHHSSAAAAAAAFRLQHADAVMNL